MSDRIGDDCGFSIVDAETRAVLFEVHAHAEPIDHAPPAWSLDGRRVAGAVKPVGTFITRTKCGTHARQTPAMLCI